MISLDSVIFYSYKLQACRESVPKFSVHNLTLLIFRISPGGFPSEMFRFLPCSREHSVVYIIFEFFMQNS